ncbi:hypothetical protein B0H17DRAFT_1061617 [Mycena rosella]|uniref:Uncharacterized protein n=1 Tax=Mycena rosella TaxID=1033263 RepID=A0AAD7DI24_MYCRO|nr:hypothetical protein B0H17DRAFT_1061617 [Mycena rosella]
MFLYSTVSTLKPIVGMVVTISPSFSLYSMVVLPAASRPTIRIRTSFLLKRPESRRDTEGPMMEERVEGRCRRWRFCEPVCKLIVR